MSTDVKAPLDDTSSRPSSFVSISPPRSISPQHRSGTPNMFDEEPPPYSAAIAEPPHPLQSAAFDPRSSSMQDLPVQQPQRPQQSMGPRRNLLLVYVHGFMGDETSFQSFPAHVHNLLSVTLGDTHVVLSKIYPRYLTKRAIGVATEDLSKWLAPHEGPDTDVVLLGHSMGGLVAADVALLTTPDTKTGSPMRHRIIGSINFDVPFLGMHPGIIMSGLTSIFKPYTPPATSPTPETSAAYDPTTAAGGWGDWSDWSNFNQPWNNDMGHERRTGWQNAWHFVNKHSNNLSNATKQLVQNHIEFGSTMADYENLKHRYARLRMLEEDDQMRRDTVVSGGRAPRIRFVNYYTASNGRPRKAKELAGESTADLSKQSSNNRSLSIAPSESAPSYSSQARDDGDDDDVSSISSLSTNSSLSSISTRDVGEDPFLESTVPPRAPKPPTLIEYDGDLPAFKKALDNYREETKIYVKALREHYTRPQRARIAARQAEVKEKVARSQAEALARSEDAKLEAEMRVEESRRIAQAKTPEERKQAVDAMRDRRQREVELRRELAKSKSASDSMSLKSGSSCSRSTASGQSRAEIKAEQKQIKREFKADINAAKKERKMYKRELKKQWKQLKKDRKALRKAKGKGRAEPGPPSVSSAGQSEPFFDIGAAQAAQRGISRSASDKLPLDEKGSKGMALSPETASIQSGETGASSNTGGDKKDRKFCLLPPRDARGNTDHTWKRVFMADVDEVGAHCGLFFPRGMTGAEPLSEESSGPGWGVRYAWMVSDVAERIEHWVNNDATERLAMGVQAL